MAEALLRARLAPIAPEVVVGSAGLLFDGREAEHHAVKALAKRGVDLADHRSQVISAELLAPTSLILGMERRHIREVVTLDAVLFPRSFTLPEFVRLAGIVGPRPAGEDLRTWVEGIGSLRNPADYAGDDRSAEIADPMGHSARTFRACAETIDEHLAVLVDLAWSTPDPRDPVVAPTTGGIHADRDRR